MIKRYTIYRPLKIRKMIVPSCDVTRAQFEIPRVEELRQKLNDSS